MSDDVKKGFKIICLECGSEDAYAGTFGGHEKTVCPDCGQEEELV